MADLVDLDILIYVQQCIFVLLFVYYYHIVFRISTTPWHLKPVALVQVQRSSLVDMLLGLVGWVVELVVVVVVVHKCRCNNLRKTHNRLRYNKPEPIHNNYYHNIVQQRKSNIVQNPMNTLRNMTYQEDQGNILDY